MMTLALLLTAATSAWAAESKPIGLNVEYEVGDKITSTTEVYVRWGNIIDMVEGTSRECVIKITPTKWPTIGNLRCAESGATVLFDEIRFEVFYQDNGESTGTEAQFIKCVGECSGDLEKVHVASGSGTLADPYVFAPGPGSSGNAFPISWSATSPNTASIEAMPAGNVTVSVDYYPQAEFAMSTGETPELLAPAAIAGVPATTDDPIVTPGTVKNIGTSEVPQGTLMYYVSTTAMNDAELQALTPDQWSADVPTAADQAQGPAYVYYYIRGAEPATIAERTDANTCSDGDILAANVVNVTLAAAPLWNAEFDLTNAPEEDKAPGVWTTDIPEGGVVKGTPVTVTYSGSKKIIGVKAVKAAASTPLDNTTTAWASGTFAVPAGGLTYSDAITVSGDVTLTLTDGETLTLNKGISLASGATLTIQGNGTMNVNGTSGSTASTVDGSGTLVLTSGTLTAKGGAGGGYGSREATSGSKSAGGVAINGTVTVSGGTLTATGGAGGSIEELNVSVTAGAGGAAISGSVTLVSGTLTATGGNGGNGGFHSTGTAGAGGAAIGGDLTVNGGTMTTTNGSNGSQIDDTAVNLGAGGKAVAGTVTDNR